MSSPLWANSFEGLLSCLLLQYFAKWFIFPARVQRLPNPRQFLATHWCGQCFPQLKQSLLSFSSFIILSISCSIVTSAGMY